MPQTRRTLTIILGSALCVGGILVFYAAAHQWVPLIGRPNGAAGHRPNLALIALLGVVALVGGLNFLSRALLPSTAHQRGVGLALGVTLCVAAAGGLLYTAQGWTGSISRNDEPINILAWAILGVVSLVVLVAGARAVYDATRATRNTSTRGARHTPQSIF